MRHAPQGREPTDPSRASRASATASDGVPPSSMYSGCARSSGRHKALWERRRPAEHQLAGVNPGIVDERHFARWTAPAVPSRPLRAATCSSCVLSLPHAAYAVLRTGFTSSRRVALLLLVPSERLPRLVSDARSPSGPGVYRDGREMRFSRQAVGETGCGDDGRAGARSRLALSASAMRQGKGTARWSTRPRGTAVSSQSHGTR
jgi:hypothetical protein